MYPTSNNYKQLVYLASTKHLLNIYIDNQKIDDKYILDFKITNTLFGSDEFVLGSVPSQEIEIKLHKKDLPVNYKNIYIETGVQDEIVPIGHFTLDSVSEDDDTVIIKALDNMTKFEFNYDGSTISLPTTLITVIEDICNKAGVELRFYFFFKSR